MEEKTEINTHGLTIGFGKHKGELWTRLPVSYLSWLANLTNPLDQRAVDIAQAELARRGSTYPVIEVSGHAIDRASLQCRKIWHNDRKKDEGLNAWLIRVGQEAIRLGERRGEKIIWKGVKFVFEFGTFYPSIKTVMRDHKKSTDKPNDET